MELPQPNQDIVAHGADIIAALRALVPDGVVGEQAGLAAFGGDALTAYRQKPLACVLPRSKDEVCAVLAFAADHNIPSCPAEPARRCQAVHCRVPTEFFSVSRA